MTTATLRGRVAICQAILAKAELDAARRQYAEAQLAQYRVELADIENDGDLFEAEITVLCRRNPYM